jgi:hypothetical protein
MGVEEVDRKLYNISRLSFKDKLDSFYIKNIKSLFVKNKRTLENIE